MKVKRTGSLVSAVLLTALMTGCCCGGGGSTTVQPAPVTVVPGSSATLGQQLTELKKALESGAITEAEYNKLKQEAIDNSNSKK